MELNQKTIEDWLNGLGIDFAGAVEVVWNDNAHIIHVTVDEDKITESREKIIAIVKDNLAKGVITEYNAKEVIEHLFVTEFYLEGF